MCSPFSLSLFFSLSEPMFRQGGTHIEWVVEDLVGADGLEVVVGVFWAPSGRDPHGVYGIRDNRSRSFQSPISSESWFF
jgi:hypothetical protein